MRERPTDETAMKRTGMDTHLKTSPSGGEPSAAASDARSERMGDTRRCTGPTCTAEIRFVKIETWDKRTQQIVKRPHPIDIVPNAETGNIVVVADEGIRVGKAKKADMVARGHKAFYTDHFKTCPDAKAFRERSAKRAEVLDGTHS